jgi:glycosyltransferase involved in cell wall biosynthesis
MRILWQSAAPWARLSFANQTSLFAPRLKALGHEVHILACTGLDSGSLEWSGIPVYPHGDNPTTVQAHCRLFDIDLIISLWTITQTATFDASPPWCPWLPISADGTLPQLIKDALAGAYLPIVLNQTSLAMCQAAGLNCALVPHGVNTRLFAPLSKTAARRAMGLPRGAFIVGMVASNVGPKSPARKAFEEHIAAFSQFHAKYPDSILYLHTMLNGSTDIDKVLRQYDLHPCSVRYPDQYLESVGFSDQHMARLYNAFDVLLSVSMAEGFCIPLIEAQACGVPVITGEWGATGELLFAGWPVSRQEAEILSIGSGGHWYRPQVDAIADRLDQAYLTLRTKRQGRALREQARAGSLQFDSDTIANKYWKPLLDDIEDQLRRKH